MARVHSPLAQFNQANQIAKENGMFIVKRDGAFLLYRKIENAKPAYLGKCGTPAALFRKVHRCAYKH